MAELTKGGLPVCRVCENSATGIRFGVLTCDDCTFVFKRVYQSKSLPLCSAGGQCLITGNNHRFCSSCTFRRCLEVGMSGSIPRNTPKGREHYSNNNSKSTLKSSSSQINFTVNSRQENGLKKKTAFPCDETSRKKSKGRNRNEIETIKCQVCDEEDRTGFHYGATTCKACRTFFREATVPGRTIQPCEKDQRCLTNKDNRRCTECRLRKCLEIGMHNPKYPGDQSANSKQNSEVPPQNLSQGDSDNIPASISPPQVLLPDDILVPTDPSVANSKPSDIILSYNNQHWSNEDMSNLNNLNPEELDLYFKKLNIESGNFSFSNRSSNQNNTLN